jgi:hypothetical protein
LGVKVKGGMYCQRCAKPVMAQKSGHGVRNTAAIGGALATGGLSLLGAKSEKWRCPLCGGPAVPERMAHVKPLGQKLLDRAERKRVEKAEREPVWQCQNGHLQKEGREACLICGSRCVMQSPPQNATGGGRNSAARTT